MGTTDAHVEDAHYALGHHLSEAVDVPATARRSRHQPDQQDDDGQHENDERCAEHRLSEFLGIDCHWPPTCGGDGSLQANARAVFKLRKARLPESTLNCH